MRSLVVPTLVFLALHASATTACELAVIGPGARRVATPPLPGPPDAGFGIRQHPILNYKRQHNGVDYPAAVGAPVAAAMTGEVVEAGYAAAFGIAVRLRHAGDVETLYAQLSRFADDLKPGTCVVRGQIIGQVGTTGLSASPHLHFELRINGQPVDPLVYLAGAPDDRR